MQTSVALATLLAALVCSVFGTLPLLLRSEEAPRDRGLVALVGGVAVPTAVRDKDLPQAPPLAEGRCQVTNTDAILA